MTAFLKRLFFNISLIVVGLLLGLMVLDVFKSGLHIMLFGVKLMMMPVAILAAVYLVWHWQSNQPYNVI